MSFLTDTAAGFITGMLTGFGIGGGTLLMIYTAVIKDMPQLAAQGINLLYFIPAAGSALISHIKNRLIDKRAFIICSCAGALTTLASAWAAGHTDILVLRRVFGVFLLIIGINELFSCRD